ncbi:DMT family transporter [Pusillimonas sp. T7-7]|uniref:DMT family transporter n=1 Tax=Pusillimonas sp. (strain T7-7) TaxID=1007105 RepID=UPI0005A009F5|nr:DMT family transporter [Pusillimonas sp. T7-7]
MYTLIISIACSVAVSILLKVARRQNIEIDQAIAVNYVVAASLCLFILQPEPATLLSPSTPWWVLIVLGVLLPTIFLAMAGAVRHAGIVLSDAAQRLSLFIPLIAAFVLFGEDLSGSKLAGIAVALTALICLLLRPRKQDGSGNTARTVLYLLAVWLGYGAIDILFKQLAKSGAVFSSSLLAAFTLAGILIFAYLIIRRSVWRQRNVVAGIVLGLLNFSNIYFYIRAHQVFPQNPTLVFSAMNIGVISLGTLVGAGFFKEKLSLVNALGIVLAIGAIVILIPR